VGEFEVAVRAVDDEIVFCTVTDDLHALKLELEELLAVRGWTV